MTLAHAIDSAFADAQPVMTVHFWRRTDKLGGFVAGTRTLVVAKPAAGPIGPNRFIFFDEGGKPLPLVREVKGIYRIVFYADSPTPSASPQPHLVVDTNADAEDPDPDDAKLVIEEPDKKRPWRASLSVRLLCVLNSFTRSSLLATLEVLPAPPRGANIRYRYTKLVLDAAVQTVDSCCDMLQGGKLTDAIAPGVTRRLPLAGNLRPGHLTSEHNGPGLALDFRAADYTTITFPLKSSLDPANPPEVDFRVFRFELIVPNRNRRTSLRTFSARDDGKLWFGKGEGEGNWTLVQRPSIDITAEAAKADVVGRPPAAKWLLQIHGVPARAATDAWEEWLPPYHSAFPRVQGSSPLSFVPAFDPAPSGTGIGTRGVMVYQLHDRGSDAKPDFPLFLEPPWIFQEEDRPIAVDAIVVVPTSLHLCMALTEQALVTGWLPSMRTALTGAPLQRVRVPLRRAPFSPKESLLESARGVLVHTHGSIGVDTDTEAGARRVRIGALDLVFGSPDVNATAEGLLTITPTSVSAKSQFSITQIGPGGQDASVASGRDVRDADAIGSESPLIIWNTPAPPPGSATNDRYVLQFEESADSRYSQTLDLALDVRHDVQAPSPSTDSDAVIVIDRNPFLVAEVRYPRFHTKGTSASLTIATWSNTGEGAGSWQLLFKQEPFDLVMPPQGIGEQMIRRHQALVEDGSKAMGVNLAPRARLTLDPRTAQTDFTEAPWNLRRILGTPGSPKAGPEVKRLDYELLYGLTCSIQNPAIRIAELFSRVGRIAPLRSAMAWESLATTAQQQAFARSAEAWESIRRRYASRLAILEPWNEQFLSESVHAVVLKEGLTCQFRLPPASNLELPFPLEGTPNGTLAGGATRGFESKNVLQATLLNQGLPDQPQRTSDSAELSDFYLSSLGGWGRQMAGFQGNLTKVYGDAAMGRTYRYKIERLGRIGVFWNLAKHVVVYERVVVPSRQFAGTVKDAPVLEHEQRALTGWPALRKVREFVEIIEDTRQFPDTGHTDTTADEAERLRRARGFVAHISFPPGAQFNVLSAWGSDIGDTGWKVPLWNPAANPADVYPRPQVSLGVITGQAQLGEIVPCEIAEPQQLVFYTQTKVVRKKKGSNELETLDPDRNPHAWAPAEGVDFVNAPLPRPSKDFTNGDARQYSPDDGVVGPGYGACTFKLRPSSAPINIVAERAAQAQQPMVAALESVTMVRGLPKSDAWPTDVASVALLEQRLKEGCAQLLRELPLKDRGVVIAAAEVERVRQVLANGNPFGPLVAAATNAKAAVTSISTDGLRDRIKAFEQGLCENAKSRLQIAFEAPFASLDSRLAAIPTPTPIKDELVKWLDELRAAGEDLLLLVEGLPGAVDQFLERFAGLAIRVFQRVDRGLRVIQEEAATSTVGESLARAEELLAEVQALINAFDSLGQQRPAPWLLDATQSIKTQLEAYWKPFRAHADALLAKLRAIEDTARQDARDALETFRTAYVVPLENPALVATYLRNIGLTLAPNVDYAAIEKALQRFDDWRRERLDDWRDEITKAKQAVSNAPDPVVELRQRAASLRTWATGVSGTLLSDVQTLCNQAMARVDAIVTLLVTRLTDLQSRIEGIATNFTNLLQNIQPPNFPKLEEELRSRLNDYATATREYLDHAAGALLSGRTDIWDAADTAVRVVRAFGEPPHVPKLSFERPKLGYYFNAATRNVDLTPVTTILTQAAEVQDLAARVDNALKPLGIRMPTLAACEQLVPASLRGFDVSRIFPDFAGLNLQHLFTGLKLPDLPKENVRITHGLDQQTGRAFVRADIDVPINEPSTVFTFGPLRLQLPSARFTATTVIQGGGSERVTRHASGRITGSWQLVISDTPLVEFEGTELFFDDGGGIRFAIDPRRIKLPGVMAFLTDAMKRFSGEDDGLSFGLLPDAFRCMLSLPVPDVQAGVFGISNVRLSAAVTLKFAPEFAIGLDFGIARKEAPFALTIFILGGGGFMRIGSTYVPAKRSLVGEVEIGITVSASLAIALGPIKGGVYVFFGITASYKSGTGLAFGVLFIVRGEVNVLGIASACITLMLQASYNSQTKALVGQGSLSIKIKICWCFTLEVNEEVTYTIGSSGGAQDVQRVLRFEGLLARADSHLPFSSRPMTDLAALPVEDPFANHADDYVEILV